MTQKSASRHSNGSSASATAQLDAEYRATVYLVFLPEYTVALHVDEPAPVLDDWLARNDYRSWAFISAYNPGSQPVSDEENRARHLQLTQAADALGLPWIEGLGRPDNRHWKPEFSLFLPSIARKDALALASRFGQNAILYGKRGKPPKLIYLTA